MLIYFLNIALIFLRTKIFGGHLGQLLFLSIRTMPWMRGDIVERTDIEKGVEGTGGKRKK